MKPLRILEVVGKMDVGGTETWLMHVLRHIDRTRFSIDFLVHTREEGAYDREIKGLGSKVIPCLGTSRPWQYARNFGQAITAYGPYDVVHTHVNYFSGLPLWLAARGDIPSRVAHSHTFTLMERESAGPKRRAYIIMMERLVARYSTARLAVSERAARSLFGVSWRSDPLCRILYCGVDLAPFQAPVDKREVRTKLGVPPDSFVIGHVGRFTEPKNHAFLLRIAQEAARIDNGVRLLLVGNGPLRATIQQQAGELGLAENVIFTGVRDDVPRLLIGAMDVFVFPSLYEGLGLSLIEAQAAGLPCLYSDAITPEVEVVRPLMRRVSLESAPSFWGSLAFSHSREASIQNCGNALETVLRSPFNIERNVEQLSEIYEALAHGRPKRVRSLPSPRGAVS